MTTAHTPHTETEHAPEIPSKHLPPRSLQGLGLAVWAALIGVAAVTGLLG